jgi:transcriptional regulator with XRE-family HTH domain
MRDLRIGRKWSADELGREIGCSGDHAGKIELGTRAPDENIARALDRIFGTGTFFEDVQPLVVSERVPGPARSLAEHEDQATIIKTFMPLIVPGLLQTEEYARTLVLAGPTPHLEEEIVTERLRRQTILSREDPPRMLVLIDEAVLRRAIGGPAVMRTQLDRLLEAAQRHHLTIQAIPAETAAYDGLASGFTLLSFDEGADAAFVEGAGGTGRMIDEPGTVAALEKTYDLIRSVALPVDATTLLIKEIREAL